MNSLDNYGSRHCGTGLPSAWMYLLTISVAGCATYSVSDISPAFAEEWLDNHLIDRDFLSNNLSVRFRWELREPDLRVDGLGVVRLGAPDRARVDLFLENGESVLSAALVGDEIRVGQQQTYLGVIPSPPLLWASLGLFRPGQEAVLVNSETLGSNGIRLVYSISSTSQLRYDIFENRIGTVNILEHGQTVHSVNLELETLERLPSRATYRNLNSYRELVIILETANGVEPYDEKIWHPGS